MTVEALARESAHPAAPRTRTPTRKQLLSLLAIGFACAAVAYAYDWWTTGRWLETTDDAYLDGNVTAISPQVAGRIAEILVDDNQHVHAGQVLIRLDADRFRVGLARAEAAIAQKEASLARVKEQKVLQQSLIHEAAAKLAANGAEAAFARADALRNQSLFATKVGSQRRAQQATAASERARAMAQSARAGLAAAKQQLTVLDGEIAESEAAVAAAKADLRRAKLDLDDTEIRAPIDGYVGNRSARLGAFVAEGAYLLTLVPSDHLWINANFKEDQLARMRPGQSATIVADVLPGHVFHGRVESFAPAAGAVFSIIPPENATGNFTKIVQRVTVRIAVDDHAAAAAILRPGLSTTVTVDTKPQ